ncbi:MAG: hypothetical protein FJX76_28465 [Armatimonadetes bacterium]|nr:hypothetical protein [Armatimonadota bacterium]
MVIPRGNVLFEKESLAFPDINVLLSNLEQQGFTGYIRLDLFGPEGYLFYSHGQFLRAVEVDSSMARVHAQARLLNKVKTREVPTSVYVMASQMVNVLSLAFAFQPLYLNVEVKKKELKKIRDAMESESQTGIMELHRRDGTQYLLVDQGRIVFNTFARYYGQVMCGIEEVSKYLEVINKEGAQVNIFAEKAAEIENKRRDIEEELERIKPLIAKSEGGFFTKDDVVRVDDYVVREWGGVKGNAPFIVEMETPDGTLVQSKCTAAKKLGGYVSMSTKLMKKLKLRDGDLVSVRPVR